MENTVQVMTGRPKRTGDKTNVFEKGDTVWFKSHGDIRPGVVVSTFVVREHESHAPPFHCEIAETVRVGRYITKAICFMTEIVFPRECVLTEKLDFKKLFND